MASKKISELDAKTPVVTDVLAVADPATGIAGKSDCGQVTYAGMNQSKVIPFGGSFAFQPAVVTLTANRDNLALGANAFIRISSTGNYDLTGIVPLVTAETNMGRIIYIINVGSNTINLKHESLLSDAANRFITHTGNQASMNAGHIVLGIYDTIVSRWRVWDLT